MSPLLVLTNLPDVDSARSLAKLLVEQRLAACVNVLSPAQAVYRWQGSVETAEEIPLLIKTVAGCYAELEATIKANHPYQLPEIIAMPIALGLPAYLAWLESETAVVTRTC